MMPGRSRRSRDTWVHTFGTLYPPEDLNAYLTAKYGEPIQRAEIADEGTRYFLAERDGALVGYCMVGALDMPVEDSGAVELHRLYVAEDVRGRRRGAGFDADGARLGARANARAIYLSVWENNHRASAIGATASSITANADFMVGRVADRDYVGSSRSAKASPPASASVSSRSQINRFLVGLIRIRGTP